MTRTALALLSLTALCRCGAADLDPCTAPTSGVTLSPPDDTRAPGTTLACNGNVDGEALACAGAAEVRTKSCADGFGVAVTSNDVTVLIHFRNEGRWTAGAKLEGGPDVTGSMTVSGLSGGLQPAAGTTHWGAFFLVAGDATLNGTYASAW